ncbi:integrase core domain-containing protein [Luteibacter sp. PPL201]|uniref:Integrase core domain-containing protein n=1 Tax=Luteibacter sahnii TaxID=3021977 RepID=A0ABT6BDR8_9GAMM|nr:integrase core domain-containing protein [Luteibacter sp. PPL193]MDY1548872.1 integrase core domain-containing protein [Luteibacter sp. PPL193]
MRIPTPVCSWTSRTRPAVARRTPAIPNANCRSITGRLRTALRTNRLLSVYEKLGDPEWFRSRAEARVLIERWRQFYNEQRPHGAHGYKPPASIRRGWVEPDNITVGLTV